MLINVSDTKIISLGCYHHVFGLLLFMPFHTGSQYTNGDTRLYLNGSTSLNNTIGVLEIFLNDRWGTVCGDEFNIGSAAAACRQLGFLKALHYGSPQEFK